MVKKNNLWLDYYFWIYKFIVKSGGCEGNANNFEKIEDCNKQCASAPVQSIIHLKIKKKKN